MHAKLENKSTWNKGNIHRHWEDMKATPGLRVKPGTFLLWSTRAKSCYSVPGCCNVHMLKSLDFGVIRSVLCSDAWWWCPENDMMLSAVTGSPAPFSLESGSDALIFTQFQNLQIYLQYQVPQPNARAAAIMDKISAIWRIFLFAFNRRAAPF